MLFFHRWRSRGRGHGQHQASFEGPEEDHGAVGRRDEAAHRGVQVERTLAGTEREDRDQHQEKRRNSGSNLPPGQREWNFLKLLLQLLLLC